ncbi:MAG: hypothetical protein HQL03_15610 [Nitrospirae bacterium]|uniref:hypothetical protein n=1 Tax=Candidatus Magnetominusculus dajiuhuensis TaxID=3137712 RepID=UPI0019DDED43|nr:hypothetical protein [Nitrospirota bacterium]
MKKMLIVVLAFCMAIAFCMSGPVTAQGATNVYYYLPYLTTVSGAQVYCMVSNFSTDDVTSTTFTVMASSLSQASQTARTFPSINNVGKGRTQLIIFSGQAITVDTGTQVVDLTSDTGSANSYGGTLKFSSSGSTGVNCKTLLMTCFQGTTNPKRNLVGYLCEDDSSSGPGNTNNLIGY